MSCGRFSWILKFTWLLFSTADMEWSTADMCNSYWFQLHREWERRRRNFYHRKSFDFLDYSHRHDGIIIYLRSISHYDCIIPSYSIDCICCIRRLKNDSASSCRCRRRCVSLHFQPQKPKSQLTHDEWIDVLWTASMDTMSDCNVQETEKQIKSS